MRLRATPAIFALGLPFLRTLVEECGRQGLLALLGMKLGSQRPAKPKKSNHANALKKLKVLVLIAILLLAFCEFFRTSQGEIPKSPLTLSDFSSLRFFSSNIDFPSPTDASSLRPVYPYSVIPRGVETAEELRTAIHRDPVVSAHYSDFRVRAVRAMRLPREHQFFVSYRVGNQVYWTKKRITLPSGEILLTDGEHLARTRCGNRLSEIPLAPTAPSEPSDHSFNTPVVPLRPELTSQPLPGSPIWPASPAPVLLFSSGVTPEPAPSPVGFFPPFIPIACCVSSPGSSSHPSSPVHPAPPLPSPSSPTPPPQPAPYFPAEPPSPPQPPAPPIAAPEPSALALAAAGLILLLCLRGLRHVRSSIQSRGD